MDAFAVNIFVDNNSVIIVENESSENQSNVALVSFNENNLSILGLSSLNTNSSRKHLHIVNLVVDDVNLAVDDICFHSHG